MPNKQKTSDWFCAAVSGPTIDGREITTQEIIDMSETYNPSTFSAQVFVEHVRPFSFSTEFSVMGDVIEVETRDVKILDKTEKGLFVKIDATEELVEFNKQRKKVFPSVEIKPNFANSGKSYLCGLAVTDDPASLGTEKIKLFSKGGADKKYSTCFETQIEFKEIDEKSEVSLLSKIFSSLLDKKDETKETTEEKDQTAKAQITPPQQDNNFSNAAVLAIVQDLEQFKTKSSNEFNALHKENDELKAKLAELNLPQTKAFKQEQVAGSEKGIIEADC